MRQYILRRMVSMIPVLLGVTIAIFFLFKMAPGDPTNTVLDPHMTAQKRMEMRAKLGLNDPLPVQYAKWLGKAVQGDLGYSIKFQEPVVNVIGQFLWPTFLLSLIVLIAQYLLAIPLGVITATKQYSAGDKIATVLSSLGISLPSFFLALFLIWLFAIKLKWFPVSGMTTAGAKITGWKHIVDVAKHMVLPALTLTLLSTAGLMRYVRSSMLEVVRQDYVRTARAKGLSEGKVIYKHALRNALLPIVTFIGFALPSLFTGALITETLFSWPGVGPVQYQAIGNRDYPLLMGFSLFLSILTMIGNLLSDVLYALVDPRIRFK